MIILSYVSPNTLLFYYIRKIAKVIRRHVAPSS